MDMSIASRLLALELELADAQKAHDKAAYCLHKSREHAKRLTAKINATLTNPTTQGETQPCITPLTNESTTSG